MSTTYLSSIETTLGISENSRGARLQQMPKQKVLLWVFMAVIAALFFLFAAAYVMRIHYGDWKPTPDPTLLWLNTGILLLSSLAIGWSYHSLKHDNRRHAIIGFILAGELTLAFIIGQLLVWRLLIGWGYTAADNPANGFFYLFTGIHGLHLIGGLVLWTVAMRKLARSTECKPALLNLELCATYWHCLLVVWLFLFTLLVASPESIKAVVKYCGFT